MKRIFKKSLAVLLAVITLSTMIPFAVFATGQPNEPQGETEAEFSPEAGLGKIVNNLSEAEENSNFFVSEVTVEGKKATVEYAASADCKMVVAVYNEKTFQMLGSGVTDVSKDEAEAEVEININSMPSKFLVKVFLLGENNQSLCQPFSNYRYTTVYEEFLKKTPDDFKGEEVIPFDEEADDFGVLEDDVTSLEASSKTTYTYDSENHIFVFKNATDEIKKLKVGEVLYYECGEKESDFILLKVKEITVSGSTVTIIEDEDVALEDAFKFLRIDAEADFSEVRDEDVELGSCIDFDNSKVSSKALVDESPEAVPYSHTFEISYPEKKDDDPEAWEKGIEVKGTLEYSLTSSIRLYYDVNWGPDYYEFRFETKHEATLSVSVSGKIKLNKEKVGIEIPADFGAMSVAITVYPVVYFEAEINLITVGVNITNTMYITHDSGGVQKNNAVRTTKPAAPDIAKVKPTFEIGLGIEAEAQLGKGVFAKAAISVEAGGNFTAEIDTVGLWADKNHDCYFCLNGKISLFVRGDVKLSLEFISENFWAAEWKPLDVTVSWFFSYFYISWSSDGLKIDLGECDRIEQEVTVSVYNEDGKKLKGATVSTTTGRCDAQGDKKLDDTSMKTDKNGKAVFYFKRGDHSVTASADEHIDRTESFKVMSSPKSVSVELKKSNHILTVNVVDEKGKPIKGAKLTAVGDAEDDGISETITSYTDSAGVTMMELANTTYKITVSADDHKTKTFTIYIDEDREEKVVLAYQKTYELKVNVSDEEGKSLSGASVIATGDPDGDGTNESSTAITNSSGVAEMNLPQGTWNIIVSLKNYKTVEFTITNLDKDSKKSVTLEKNNLENGDLIEFGSYPQSRVTDENLLSTLNSLSKTWVSYGYYSGDGEYYGSMVQGDWMKYANVSYGGNNYRAVIFSQYRPEDTCLTSSARNAKQDDNGYNTNTVYWFKYEPLKWRVLDADEGLVMCESIIDSQAFSNTIYYKSGETTRFGYFNNPALANYANDYATSSIREWLNNDFYNTAFSSSEKAEIGTTTLDNSSWSSSYPQFDSATTNDKIFLLSYDEVINTAYGFLGNENRKVQGTDYAKCQGLYIFPYTGCSPFLLRSPNNDSRDASGVDGAGYIPYGGKVYDTDRGIRPAFKFNLESEISKSSSQKTKSNSAPVSNSETLSDVSTDVCVAGNDYLILNVKGYSADFVLTSENLLYINQVTADKNGKVDTSFIPKETVSDSTTLLIGDFGRGVQVHIMGKTLMSVTVDDIRVRYKTTANLNPQIVISEDVDYTVTYTSSDDGIVVDENGVVYSKGDGEAVITVTVTDEYGNTVQDTCVVNGYLEWWQWFIILFLFGLFWY